MMNEKWILPSDIPGTEDIAHACGISRTTAAVMMSRGIDTPEKAKEYLHPDLNNLHDASLLLGAAEASELLYQKIRQQKKIRIIGDYDIDGVCSTYILYDTISELGGIVDWDIPDRIEDGYGLNVHLIHKALEAGIDTIITCDNGIAAFEPIALAKEHGITVILTDHHSIQKDQDTGREVLPPADVIVDPHREGETYPFPDICGAVVAWKVMQLLYRLAGQPRRILHNLSMAAFATIGDVMDLKDENRILVHYGLQGLTRTPNPGMQALIRLTGALGRTSEISTYAVGFVLGPCINAAGRLDTARRSVNLLIEQDPVKIEQIAADLVELNTERQEMTKRGVEDARRLSEEEPYASDRVLLIYLPDSSESIVGIIAGKVREKTGKPTFVLTPSQKDPDILKGSGRSIEEYDMFAHMQPCMDLLTAGGGHPMAAGLSLKRDNLDILRREMNRRCLLSEEDIRIKVKIDAVLPVDEISEHLIEELTRIEPCGKGNEKPLFGAFHLQLLSVRVMGAKRNAVRLTFASGRGTLQGIMFCDGDVFIDQMYLDLGAADTEEILAGRGRSCGVFMDAAYVPQINEFRGERSVQMQIKHFRWSRQ